MRYSVYYDSSTCRRKCELAIPYMETQTDSLCYSA